jgi:hypothetical protein
LTRTGLLRVAESESGQQVDEVNGRERPKVAATVVAAAARRAGEVRPSSHFSIRDGDHHVAVGDTGELSQGELVHGRREVFQDLAAQRGVDGPVADREGIDRCLESTGPGRMRERAEAALGGDGKRAELPLPSEVVQHPSVACADIDHAGRVVGQEAVDDLEALELVLRVGDVARSPELGLFVVVPVDSTLAWLM